MPLHEYNCEKCKVSAIGEDALLLSSSLSKEERLKEAKKQLCTCNDKDCQLKEIISRTDFYIKRYPKMW